MFAPTLIFKILRLYNSDLHLLRIKGAHLITKPGHGRNIPKKEKNKIRNQNLNEFVQSKTITMYLYYHKRLVTIYKDSNEKEDILKITLL